MAVRRGPNHASVTLATSANSLGIWLTNLFNATSDFLLVPLWTSFQNSLTSLPTGITATTGAYGATGGTQYYYKLLDLVSGLF